MAQVDPNIQAILDQHQQELQLLGQHWQHQQQHQQQQHQNQQNRLLERQTAEWVAEEKVKVTECDGSSLRAVRVWLRAVQAAVPRVPAHLDADTCIRKLMEATAREDLQEEFEVFMGQQANRAQVQHDAIRAHLLQSFLGPDEQNVLKEEVKHLKQASRDDLPRFNRRFAQAADHAYPLPRNAAIEEELADLYMGALREGKVKDKCFGHDPRLITLQAAMQVASDEWARQRRRQRVQRDVRGRAEEPMEVDEVAAGAEQQPPLREVVTALAASVRGLQQSFQEMKQLPTAAPGSATAATTAPQQAAKRDPPRCWNCGARGHFRAQCRKPRRRGQAPGSASSQAEN